jgi:hypothetical protein
MSETKIRRGRPSKSKIVAEPEQESDTVNVDVSVPAPAPIPIRKINIRKEDANSSDRAPANPPRQAPSRQAAPMASSSSSKSNITRNSGATGTGNSNSNRVKVAKDVRISNTAQIDDDFQFALALSKSEEAIYNNASEGAAAAAATFGMDEEFTRLRKEQEAADEEFARELAKQMEAEYNPPPSQNYDDPQPHHSSSHNSSENESVDRGDARSRNDGQAEIDAYFEELARREAAERLHREGHAYKAKPNINRILEDEERKEAELLAKAKRTAELKAWREERARQDAEYKAMLEHDMQAAANEEPYAYYSGNPDNAIDQADQADQADLADQDNGDAEAKFEPEPEEEPITQEEMRRARLAFFLNKQSAMH